MKFRLSPAESSHCALLSRMHGLCFTTAWSADAFADLIAMPGAFALLVSLDGPDGQSPIGFALARTGGGECEIITLGVLPEYRGQGAGAALIEAILSRAGEMGAGEVLLEVASDNRSAIALYQSAEFVAVGRRKNYYRGAAGGPGDAIIMRRSLLQS